MNIKLDRFLAITAVLATAGAMAVGCKVEDNSTNNYTGGTAGAGGGSAGAGGSAGSAGSAGTAGTAGSAGSGGSAGGDAGVECIGDELSGGPDAGIESGICYDLAYAATVCDHDNDPGTEDIPSAGMTLCNYMEWHGRPGVFEELYGCLDAITGDACAAAHDTAVNNCISTVFPMACEVGPVQGSAGAVTCQDIVDACETTETPISLQECQDSLNALKEDSRKAVVECYDDQAPNTGTCVEDFTECVFNVDAYAP